MTPSSMSAEWWARLEPVLDRLAAPADRQAAYLTGLGTGGLADELAMEFDDIFRPLQPLLRERADAANVLQALQRLDQALSDGALQWSMKELDGSDQWREIRILANQAMRAMVHDA